jgi:glycosyltransferase involved in cell wall biosynthesis
MKPKVAVVAYSAPPHSSGGVATAHYNLARSLSELGFSVRLFTFGDLRPGKGSVVRNGTPKWFSALVSRVCKYAFWLLAPGKEAYQTADILSSQWGAWRMSRAIARFAPNAIVLSDHGAPGLALRKPAGAKLILVSHHNPARFVSHASLRQNSKRDARIAVWFEQFAVNKADAVVCPSRYMQGWFRKTYKFRGPVRVIPNLVDAKLLASIRPSNLRARMKLKSRDVLVAMPSAGGGLKGGRQLATIVKKLAAREPNVAFYIPGPRIDLGRHRVHAPGPLSYTQHIANLKVCDFGISPSVMENYSMALLEAVTCGVPMVAYDTGGNKEIIAPGISGFLAAEGNASALVNKAALLFNPTRRRKMQAAARSHARTHLSASAAARAYAELIAD